jgi:hypothetical protein
MRDGVDFSLDALAAGGRGIMAAVEVRHGDKR